MTRLDRLTNRDLPISVGGYELVVALGERLEGRVFRADCTRLGNGVEVTALWPSWLALPGVEDKLARGLSGLRDFTHPAALRILDVGRDRGTLWFASESIVGVTLGEVTLGPVRGSVRQALDVAIVVLDVLDAAHQRQFDGRPQTHLGLTPDRVLVTERGSVKVRGFGLGAMPTGMGASDLASPWAAPEQIGRGQIGCSADLFSLGAILSFALTGEPPFQSAANALPAERVSDIVRAVTSGELFQRLEVLAAGLGSAMEGLLAIDPTRRFASAGQARQALNTVVSRLAPGEHLGGLARRMLVDHASTVAAPYGASPTSRDLLPLGSQSPGAFDEREETADTDADFRLPSQRPAGGRKIEEDALERLDLDDPSDVRGKRSGSECSPGPPNDSGLPSELGARKTTAMPHEALAPIRSEQKTEQTPRPPEGPARPPVAAPPPRRPIAPRPPAPPPVPPPTRVPVAAPRRAPVAAPRRAPVAAPRPSTGTPDATLRGEASLSGTPSWAPPVAPPSPGLRSSGIPPALRPGGAGPSELFRSDPHGAPRRASSVSGDAASEGRAGRIVTAVALATIVFGVLGLLALHFQRGGAGSGRDAGDLAALGEPSPASPPPASPPPASPPPASPPPASPPSASPPPALQPPAPSPLPTEPRVDRSLNTVVSLDAPVDERTPLPPGAQAPSRVEEPPPRRSAAPDPVDVPDGPVVLRLKHRPLKKGQAGSSDLVSVRVDGPKGVTVSLHHGPMGGPHSELRLRAKSGGRFEEWLNFPSTPGSTLEYWVVAEHPSAERPSLSGSRVNPHRLVLE